METQTLDADVNKILQEKSKWNLKNILKDIGVGFLNGTLGAHALPFAYLKQPEIFSSETKSPWEVVVNSKGTTRYGHNLLRMGISISTTAAELGTYVYLGFKGIPAYCVPIGTNSLSAAGYLYLKVLEVGETMRRNING